MCTVAGYGPSIRRSGGLLITKKSCDSRRIHSSRRIRFSRSLNEQDSGDPQQGLSNTTAEDFSSLAFDDTSIMNEFCLIEKALLVNTAVRLRFTIGRKRRGSIHTPHGLVILPFHPRRLSVRFPPDVGYQMWVPPRSRACCFLAARSSLLLAPRSWSLLHHNFFGE